MRILVKHSFDSDCQQCHHERLKEALHSIGVDSVVPDPFEIEVREGLSLEQLRQVRSSLEQFGIELITDHKEALIEQIKRAIDQLVEAPAELESVNLQAYLRIKFYYSYSHLARVFADAEHVSPEHYLVTQKIKRAKEYLFKSDLPLSEIASRLNYGSIAHFSHQFKNLTGMSAMAFRSSTRRDGFFGDGPMLDDQQRDGQQRDGQQSEGLDQKYEFVQQERQNV